MANTYTSSNVENGLTFDELLGRLLAYKPEQWGFTEQDYNEIKSDFGVNSNDLWYLPAGNYKVMNLPNSPFNSSFVNISVANLSNKKFLTCDIGGIEKYTAELTAAGSSINWVNVTNNQRSGNNAVIFHVGSTAPTNTSMVWIDTSKLSTDDSIYLRYHNGSSWVSYSFNGVMLQDVYDKQKLNKDPYDAIMDAIEEFVGEYANFTRHSKDELTLIHISANDREYYDTYLLTSTYLAQYFADGGALHTELINYLNSKVTETTGIDIVENESAINTLRDSFTTHTTGHITSDDVTKWNNKADGDHEHELDANVTIAGTNVVASSSSTEFALNQLSTEVQERAYAITNINILASAISATDLAGMYHNGNTLYVDNTDGTTSWWKIIDNTKFGTSNYLQGVKEFNKSSSGNITFSDIQDKPTTLAGYGITDGVTNNEFNTISNNIDNSLMVEITPAKYSKANVGSNDLYIGIQKTLNSNGGGTVSYPMSTKSSDLDIIVAIGGNNVDKFRCLAESNIRFNEFKLNTGGEIFYWEDVCYGDGKYVAVAVDGKIAVSTDGITWISVAHDINWYSWNTVCYGNNMFVAMAEGDYFAYSYDGIVWELGYVGESPRHWRSVCYGNDKFVAVDSTNMGFSYSIHDEYGIYWQTTYVNLENAYWFDVCYGKDKFVAIANGNKQFAYSTDGIDWTVGTISSTTRNWTSVCYGKDKFVAVADSSNVFAYSYDGITWTEKTVGNTNRYWQSICYGNGKFIAIAHNSTIFVYSFDGINWNEGTISTVNRPWRDICYGNDKFIAVTYGSDTFGYIDEYYTPAGISQYPSDIPASNYFSTIYTADASNPNWASNGLGRMLKVDKTKTNVIINETIVINGSEYPLFISWDINRGLVFSQRIDRMIEGANDVLDNLNESQNGLTSMIAALNNYITNST